MSKTGSQFMKEDTTQRNGESELCSGGGGLGRVGERVLGLARKRHQAVGSWDSYIWEGPHGKRDWEIISPI